MGIDGDIILKAGLDTTGVTKKIDELKKSVSRSLKNIIRIGFGVRSVFALIRKLRTSLISGIGDLAQVHQPLTTALSEIKTSLTLLKHTFASAFSPIIETVAPILSQFITMIANAVSQVGQFIAALTGKEYIQAGAVWTDYADSVNKSAKSTTKQTSATEKQIEAQKELNREITHFDDLVILHEKHDNTSPTTTTPTTQQTGFSPAPIGDAVAQFAKDFKAAWEKADFTDLGTRLGLALKTSLDNINWSGIKQKLSKVAKSIATFLNGFLEAPGLFKSIGRTIGNAINAGLTALDKFAWNFHWSSLGTAISDAIIAACDTIDWSLVHSTVSGFASGLAEYLNSLFTEDTFSAIGTTVGKLLNSALTFLNVFGDTFNASEFGKSLASGLNSALKEIKPTRLLTGVITLINTIRDAVVGFLDNVNWYELGTKLRDIICNIPWKLLFLSFGVIIWRAINSVVSLFMGLFDTEKISGPVTDALNSLKSTVDGIVDLIDFDTLSKGFGDLVAALAPAGEGFAVGFIDVMNTIIGAGSELLGSVGPAIQAVADALADIDPDVLESIGLAFGIFVGGFVTFNGLTNLGGILKSAATHVGSLLSTLSAHPLITIGIGLGSIALGFSNLAESGFFADKDTKNAINNCDDVIRKTQEVRQEAQLTLDTIQGKNGEIEATYSTLRGLATEYFELKEKVTLTKTEQERLNELEDTLTQHLPDFQQVIGDTSLKYSDQKQAVFDLIGETERYYKVLAAQEFLKKYYEDMFKLEIAIKENEAAYDDLVETSSAWNEVGILGVDQVVQFHNALEGSSAAIDRNVAEHNALIDQQNELRSQYSMATELLNSYGLTMDETGESAENLADNIAKPGASVEELGSKADNAQTDTSNLAGSFDAFKDLSISTPLKMALIATALDMLASSGETSEENADNLYTTLNNFTSDNATATMADVQEAFDNTGISAESFQSAVETAMGELGPTTQREIQNAIQALKDSNTTIETQAKETAGYVGKGSEKGLEESTDSVVDAGKNMMEETIVGIKNTAQVNSPSERTKEIGKNVGEGLKVGISSKKPSLLSLARQIMSDVIKQINSYKNSFNDTGRNLMQQLNSGVESYRDKLPNTVRSIIVLMKNTAKSLSFTEVGKNIAAGIYNGLFSRANWLETLAWNTAVQMYNSACEALGIASPSKKFAWIGEMLVTGLGNGITDNEDVAVDAVSNLTDTITEEAKGTNMSIQLDTVIDSWINNLDTVLIAFSDKIISEFDTLINTLSNISTISFALPAVAQGQVIPSAIKSSSMSNDNEMNMMRMLENLTSNQITIDELRPLLIEMFQDYMNLGWYVGDEQLARHVNNGNLLLDRRYSIIK